MKISTTNPARIGLVNIGAPAAGINAAIRAVVRKTIHMGSTPVVIKDGIGGLLVEGVTREYLWSDVRNFALHGGTNIGTTRKIASYFGTDVIIKALKEHNLSGLIIIGGYEAYITAQ